MPNVSVIVSTYNRAESLCDTLKSLVRQEANGYSYEIIVVDNNSTDNTRKVVQEFASRLNQRIRYLFERRQGLSFARNTGIREAEGELIAFTDDDVVCDRNWVASLWDCYKDTGALAIGGKIERLWNCERPEWLSDEITGPLISQDLGPFRKRWESKTRHMVGANMAFHRSVFEKFGFFREELGRKGDQLIGGEDRELFLRLTEASVPIFYEPEAVVAHKVEGARLSKEFLRRWFRDVGKTLGHGLGRKPYHLLTIAPFWLWRDIVLAFWKWAKVRMQPISSEAERFASTVWVIHYSAIFSERWIHWVPFGLLRNHCTFVTIQNRKKESGKEKKEK